MVKMNDSITSKYEIIIHAPVDEIFRLACPVMEYKWINGWKCKLINCPNGYVELGCIFKEIMTTPILQGNFHGKTTWITVKNDTDNHIRHYELKNKVSKTLWQIKMSPLENAVTDVILEITYTANTKRAQRLIQDGLSEKLFFIQSILNMQLKYYCENKKIMPKSELMDFIKKSDCFTFSDKIKLILNKLTMALMADNDRKKFFSGKPISKKYI